MTKPFFTSDDCEYHPDTICYISLDKANALIRERGKVVYGDADDDATSWVYNYGQPDTHRALLICVEPIQKDTAEKVLAELVADFEKYYTTYPDHQDIPEVQHRRKLHDRAKRLLEEK